MSTITIKHFTSTEPLAITREWIETMKNMPERAAVTTELFKEQFTRFENQRIEFADLCDAGT